MYLPPSRTSRPRYCTFPPLWWNHRYPRHRVETPLKIKKRKESYYYRYNYFLNVDFTIFCNMIRSKNIRSFSFSFFYSWSMYKFSKNVTSFLVNNNEKLLKRSGFKSDKMVALNGIKSHLKYIFFFFFE